MISMAMSSKGQNVDGAAGNSQSSEWIISSSSSPFQTNKRYSLDPPYSSEYSPPQSPSSNLSDPLPSFFYSLRSEDSDARRAATEYIINTLSNPENEKLLKSHLSTIVVLSTESPFEDVTESFTNFLKPLYEKFHIPKQRTTIFTTESQLPQLNTDDELTRKLFQDVFLQQGRVNHLIRTLGWHPQYLEKFLLAYNTIMRDPGPLPFHWRNYIGILTAARYKCSYIISLQEHEFLLNGGDSRWLQGIDYIPAKLKNLLRVIELMAHQPWLLPKLDIEYLVKGSDAWSIAELVHAMVLICTFLSLSGFVFCCGITPECGLSESGSLSSSFSLNDSDCEIEDTAAYENTEKVMELLKNRRGQPEDDDDEYHDRQQDFHNAGMESESGPPSNDLSQSSSSTTTTTNINPSINLSSSSSIPSLSQSQDRMMDFSRYIGNNTLTHTDFDVSSREYSIFSVQEYSWREHGYELVSRYFPDAAPLLDEEFSFVYTMTYYRFNENTDIDTLPFRRAVWYYVQRVKGMLHDDYNYQEVNMFLSRSLKNFVKKAVCFPESIKRDDYAKLGYSLKPDEKCHLSLLAICSHKQASLLYGLYTVMNYQNRR
ncbi:hypothetical protein DICPUDRAFT_98918 [Dictyostelium purpureum]|uniref:Sestrin n=1 Tax=Dictyostelium purpureum TaxID=5786 RepID=F0ZUS8_DICPU|nr:uncharacterized protein DICPUDRAFT_98918 [Dictyostelium purpureum]EGC32293.1 hypothetical protein DICPUDRAFT_98918 [Dictyostelium purpureum]|eukprot:XP_003291171.1 hypothetical protein DICPUDRAFT_98918 [Dictyostelium purpureum]